MIEEIKIDNSVIPFMPAKYHLGQRVSVDRTVGYIIGMQRDKYSWSYLVVEGEAPNDDSSEDWHPEGGIAQ